MSTNNATAIWSGTAVGISILPNGVVLITFDDKFKRVNLLSSVALTELSTALDELDKLDGVSGVIFLSGKTDSFIVGAAINEIAEAQEESVPWYMAYRASQRGKAIFSRIARLAYPTVAAIHGRCLGGGTELTLVCKKRLVSDSEKTAIGLPEVALGVIPGWGGTVRATKLVGLRMALALVLEPMKQWNAKKDWRTGLVSEVVPEGQLFERAVAVALGASTKDYRFTLKERLLRYFEGTRLGRMLIQEIVEKHITKATGGKYPAPYAALDVMIRALGTDPKTAFETESLEFARLLKTPESKALVEKFFSMKSAPKSDAE